MVSPRLSDGLFVSKQYYANTAGPISMKLGGRMCYRSGEKTLHFCAELGEEVVFLFSQISQGINKWIMMNKNMFRKLIFL